MIDKQDCLSNMDIKWMYPDGLGHGCLAWQ